MSISVRTNLSSLQASEYLGRTTRRLASSMARVSSGKRIVSHGDDAAGAAMASNVNDHHRATAMALRNAEDGVSAIQIADAATGEIMEVLKRARGLAVQFLDDIQRPNLSGSDNVQRANEIFSEAADAINTILAQAQMNGVSLLDNTSTTTLHIGVGSGASDTLTLTGTDLTATSSTGLSLVVGGAMTVDILGNNFTGPLATIDDAMRKVSSARSTLGASHNRLESTISSLSSFQSATAAAVSRIEDADFSQETAELTRLQVMQNAGVALLAQSNSLGSTALRLIQ